MGKTPVRAILKAYTAITNDERDKAVVVYDADTKNTTVRHRDNTPSDMWEAMLHKIDVTTMISCKRLISYVKTINNDRIGTTNIVCVCPAVGGCGPDSRKKITEYLVAQLPERADPSVLTKSAANSLTKSIRESFNTFQKKTPFADFRI